MNTAIISKCRGTWFLPRFLSRYFAAISVCICLWGLTGCSGLFFYPNQHIYSTPSDYQLTYQDVFIDVNKDVKVHGWWLPASDKSVVQGTVYFLHGNAANITSHIKSVAWLPKAGYQVFLIDYRGYGQSTGVATIPDVFDDINAGFDWLKSNERVKGLPLYVLGQSLGASLSGYVVATNKALQADISAVLLDAGFSGYAAISKEIANRSWLTWGFQYPVSWAMPDDYDLLDVIAQIDQTSLLIMHSKDDDVIPYHHGQRLYQQALDKNKAFFQYHGAHISVFNHKENRQKILRYLRETAKH